MSAMKQKVERAKAWMQSKPPLALAIATLKEFGEDKAPRLAAALAYYTIFALAPLIVITVAIAGLAFGADATRTEVMQSIGGLVGKEGAEAIDSMVSAAGERTAQGGVAAALGFVALLFGAGGAFAQLESALNTMWGVEPKKKGFLRAVKDRLLSFGMVLAVGFLLLVSLAVSTLLNVLGRALSQALPGSEFFWLVVNLVVSVAVIAVLFALMFKFLPAAEIAWRDVWAGAIATALLFSIGKFLIGLYLGRSATASVYGSAGAVVIILLWIYYSAMIVLLGAEFTQVYANRRGEGVTPDEDAQPIERDAPSGAGTRGA